MRKWLVSLFGRRARRSNLVVADRPRKYHRPDALERLCMWQSVRIVGAGGKCISSPPTQAETAVQWNIQGAPGAPGTNGTSVTVTVAGAHG
jgi:hypothetical protein